MPHPWEYVGVRDSDEEGLANTPKSQTDNGFVYVRKHQQWVENPNGFHGSMSQASYAQLSAPLVFNYTWPCHVEGQIPDQAHLIFLLERYYKNCFRLHYDTVPTPIPSTLKSALISLSS
jgi:hypothetical protein